MRWFTRKESAIVPTVPFQLLTCNAEFGACRRGPGLGPEAVLYELFAKELEGLWETPIERINVRGLKPWELKGESIDLLPALATLSEDIAQHVDEALAQSPKNLILSGDHSCAVGLLSGFRAHYPKAKIGVVWLDAHGDIHSPFTSPSGNGHGMPVAALAGLDHLEPSVDTPYEIQEAWAQMKMLGKGQISPKFLPEDFFYFGIRDLEAEEWNALTAHNIRYVAGGGDFNERFQDGVELLLKWCADFDLIYVSFDVDGMDADLVPGTGTPVEGGFNLEQTHTLLSALVGLHNFAVLEICEVNPLLDQNNSVARLVADLIENLWPKLSAREEKPWFDANQDVEALFGPTQR